MLRTGFPRKRLESDLIHHFASTPALILSNNNPERLTIQPSAQQVQTAKVTGEHALMLLLLTRLLTAEGISQKASVGLSRTSIIAAFQPWIGQNQPALNITDSSSTAQQIEAVLAKSMSWF